MESSLTPNPSDSTNALLKILINKVDNSTFSEHEATLPVWTGPSSTTIWTQALAYTSLSMNLLAAFGAVLVKQWLGHFKTSRFGLGALHERCKRRQRKLDGLVAWHLGTIIAMLPIFLQMSLLFFGIALATNIWIQQHTVASVIMGTTAFGMIFYLFTMVASFRSPDCPFQTPVSIILQHVVHVFRLRTKFWAARGSILRRNGLCKSLKGTLDAGKSRVSRSITYFRGHLSHISSVLWQKIRLSTGGQELAGGLATASKGVDLGCLDATVEPIGAHAIQWIIETSTDRDIITAAARMVPEVERPDEHDVTFTLVRLKSHLYSCFDITRQLLPLTQERAVACVKAIFHLYAERDLMRSILLGHDGIYSRDHHVRYSFPRDRDFLLVSCAMDEPNELDISSLPSSDRMWLAHIFSCRLHKGGETRKFLSFVTDFIDGCLHNPKSPPRLVADCLLLAGPSTDQQKLAKLDKR
jgi:Family of unknown function (DUF6535)